MADRPRTGTLFEPSRISSSGGITAHVRQQQQQLAAAASSRKAAPASPAPATFHAGAPAAAGSAPRLVPADASRAPVSLPAPSDYGGGGTGGGAQGGGGGGHGKHKGGKGKKHDKGFSTPVRILSKPVQNVDIAAADGNSAVANGLPAPGSGAGASPVVDLSQHPSHPASGAASFGKHAGASPVAPSTQSPATPSGERPQRSAASGATGATPPPLLYNRPVALMDGRLKLVGVDTLMPLLMDSAPALVATQVAGGSMPSHVAPHPCDFTVYGAIGSQHSGRSTILNSLARTHSTRRMRPPLTGSTGTAADPSFPGVDRTRPPGFDTASHERLVHCLRQTVGVDVLVTPERNILIDTPALDAAATRAWMVSSNAPLPPGTSLEQVFELHTLQTVLLMLECCHVLLVVCDKGSLMHMAKLVHRALLIRQHLTLDARFLASGGGGVATAPASHFHASHAVASAPSFDALPDIVFVVNKLSSRELLAPILTPSAASYASLLSNLFACHPFRKGGLVNAYARGGGAGIVNCFTLPFCPDTARGVVSNTSPSELGLALLELSAQLMSLPKLPVRTRTSERDWLQHLVRVATALQSEAILGEFKAIVETSTPVPTPLRVPAAQVQAPMSAHAGKEHDRAATAGTSAKVQHPHKGAAAAVAAGTPADNSTIPAWKQKQIAQAQARQLAQERARAQAQLNAQAKNAQPAAAHPSPHPSPPPHLSRPDQSASPSPPPTPGVAGSSSSHPAAGVDPRIAARRLYDPSAPKRTTGGAGGAPNGPPPHT